jgi:hypothetical protein
MRLVADSDNRNFTASPSTLFVLQISRCLFEDVASKGYMVCFLVLSLLKYAEVFDW